MALRTADDARARWGTQELSDEITSAIIPTLGDDESVRRWFADSMRLSASPAAAAEFFRMLGDTDISEVLPTIRVPTLVLHRAKWRDAAERVTALIPGATRVQLGGDDNPAWSDDGVRLR